MSSKLELSRRDALKLMVNMGVATFAGGSMLRCAERFRASRRRRCWDTSGRPIRRRSQGVRLRSRRRWARTSRPISSPSAAGPQVIAAIAGNSMDVCNVGSSPMVVGFAQGMQDVDGVRREVHHRQRMPRGAQGCRHRHDEGSEGQEDRAAVQHVGALRDARGLEERRA